jgi:plasmid maintenance system antidote protein VapI
MSLENIKKMNPEFDIVVYPIFECRCVFCEIFGYHTAVVTHRQTGLYSEVTQVTTDMSPTFNVSALDLKSVMRDPVLVAKSQVEAILNLKKEKSYAMAYRLSNEKQTKKKNAPVHPGIVARLLLDEHASSNFSSITYRTDSERNEYEILFKGERGIAYTMAYKLSKVLENTDVRFWMDLQKDYDEFHETAC